MKSKYWHNSEETSMRTFLQIFLSIVLSIFYLSDAFAQTYTVESNGEYVMGDSDSKIEARKIALEHAKRLAIEQIGTYLESETVVKSGQLTKDDIKVYTAGIIQTTVLSENMTLLENKTTVFKIRIRANVDTALLEKKIKEIKSDTQRKKQIDFLQAENIKLLREVESLSVQLKSNKASEYRELRQRRENLLEKLEKNQNTIRVAFEKGTLLNLALESKNKLEENKKNIDDVMQFVASNTKVTLGKPRLRNDGEVADLFIDVKWRVENVGKVLNKISKFFKNPKVNSLGYIYIYYLKDYKGLHASELSNYLKNKHLRLYVEVGKCSDYVNIKDEVINLIYTRGEDTLTIRNIPIDQLESITNIDAKVITE